MSEAEKKYYNFWEYATKILGFEFGSFLEGEGTIEEWNLAIEVLYHLRIKKKKEDEEE